MKIAEKQSKQVNLLWGKVNVEHFGFSNHHQEQMGDFGMICIRENLFVFAYFLINGRIYFVSLGNPTFSNIFPRARHIPNIFESWMLCAHLYLFVVYFSFAPVISASIHRYVNYSDIQVLMKVIETETFNVDFTS